MAVFHLLDVRHRPSAEDREVSRWIQATGHPFALAVTKIDKIGKNRLTERYRNIVRELAVPPQTPFFATSAHTGHGRREMWAWVEAILEAATSDDA